MVKVIEGPHDELIIEYQEGDEYMYDDGEDYEDDLRDYEDDSYDCKENPNKSI